MKKIFLIVFLIVSAFAFGRVHKNTEIPYKHIRIHDAKVHFTYIVNQLIASEQISKPMASEVWKMINHAEPFHPGIEELVIRDNLSEHTANILKKSWDESIGLALQYTVVEHDYISWQQEFIKHQQDPFQSRVMRAFIFEQTKTACIHGYKTEDSEVHHIPLETIKKMQKESFVLEVVPPLNQPGKSAKTEIKVMEGDTIDLTRALALEGYNPVALNFANQRNVGGGVIRGAKAQEEGLFRRSTYFLGLDINYNHELHAQMNGKYIVPEFGIVYTPHVTIIRERGHDGYPFIVPYEIDFIASAAYDIANEFPFADEKEYQDKTKSKIRAILRAGIMTKHDAIVLGAFGCGAFKNKPEIVATLFSEVLHEDEFQGQYKLIVFGIINSDDNDNLSVFRNILE